MSPVLRSAALVGGLTFGAVLIVSLPSPASAFRNAESIASTGTMTSVDDLAAALSALILWTLMAWAGVLTAMTLISRDSGQLGRYARRALRYLAPRIVRGTVAATLALCIWGGGSATSMATPTTPPPGNSLDWPVSQKSAKEQSPPTRFDAKSVTVTAGDTLWGIAARHLPYGTTNADIAASVKQWWLLNRTLIGENPDIILPGQVLRVP